MNKKDLEHFRKKLEAEKTLLEGELATVGHENTDKSGNWTATSGNMSVDPADENELADKLEELEDNAGIMEKLEKQHHEVTAALKRIEDGTYGICEISGEKIEKERLEANPSARTSMGHMRDIKK